MLTMSAGASWAEWPQYLGPTRDAKSPETGLARSWPEGGPKVLWTFPLGAGYGAAAVSKGKVYVLDRVVREQDVLRCIDLVSGEEEWSFAYDAPGTTSHPGSRSVPAIDGKYVYTCGPRGDLHCIDTETRKPVWRKNIWRDFGGGGRVPMWAIGQNPLVYGDLLIVAPQTPETGAVAFDKSTGEVQWTSPPYGMRWGYASPTIVSIGGEDQVVVIGAGPGRRDPPQTQPGGSVTGLDPQTGKVLWAYKGWQCQIPVANVTEIGDGRLFITGGYLAGSAMIKVEKRDGAFAVTELYKTPAFGTHVHPAILYEGHLYGHCSTNETKDGLVCMDLDGNVKWKTGRSPVFDKGGFILADGLFLSVDGREGILYLIEPSPEGFKQLARAKLLDTKECWAPLALSDGKLVIRDQEKMRCVAVR
jgi:outer membrane protein assembly factor BamB